MIAMAGRYWAGVDGGNDEIESTMTERVKYIIEDWAPSQSALLSRQPSPLHIILKLGARLRRSVAGAPFLKLGEEKKLKIVGLPLLWVTRPQELGQFGKGVKQTRTGLEAKMHDLSQINNAWRNSSACNCTDCLAEVEPT